jgi:hypothetical protein
MKLTIENHPKKDEIFWIVDGTRITKVRVMTVENEESDWHRTLRLEVERDGKWFATEKTMRTFLGEEEVSRNPLYVDIVERSEQRRDLVLRRSHNWRTRSKSTQNDSSPWSWAAFEDFDSAVCEVAVRLQRRVLNMQSKAERMREEADEVENDARKQQAVVDAMAKSLGMESSDLIQSIERES